MDKYIVKYRNGSTSNYVLDKTKNLLIKCDSNWNKLHVTGWNVLNLTKMDYVVSIRKVNLPTKS